MKQLNKREAWINKVSHKIEDSRDDQKNIQNGSYFRQGPPRDMDEKKYGNENNFQKIKEKKYQ